MQVVLIATFTLHQSHLQGLAPTPIKLEPASDEQQPTRSEHEKEASPPLPPIRTFEERLQSAGEKVAERLRAETASMHSDGTQKSTDRQ